MVSWSCDYQVWLILSLLVVVASLEHDEGMSMALRWSHGIVVIKYGSFELASICSIIAVC